MKRTAIIYGTPLTKIRRHAVKILTDWILDFTEERPVCLPSSDGIDTEKYRLIYVGTKDSNPAVRQGYDTELTHPEEYRIRVKEDNIWIEGYDDCGVMYGCVDFYCKYLTHCEAAENYSCSFRNPFEDVLPDFFIQSSPAAARRGIWTWGHVIYDYRRFIDHMALLKMNTLIVWNDFVPVDADEMIEYAHSCGVRVIWGFPWCWDTDCTRFSMENLDAYGKKIFADFEKEFSGLCPDGIYFQSFTELGTDRIGDVLIADAVTGFVNKTAALFFDRHPDLELQFGLHSDSVRNHLEFIRNVDNRIHIIWENCGSFPFTYNTENEELFENTKKFVSEIAGLRGKDEKFGVVTKGLVNLDWSKFRHLEGPAYIGTASDSLKRSLVMRRNSFWKSVQALWLVNAGRAYEMIKLMTDLKKGNLEITGLVEDSMFEENIFYPAALYAEMLWDQKSDIQRIISETALRKFVEFA